MFTSHKPNNFFTSFETSQWCSCPKLVDVQKWVQNILKGKT